MRDTPQVKELEKLLCDPCYTHMMKWEEGRTLTPFVVCNNCAPKIKVWLHNKGIVLPDPPSKRTDPSNPFPHPEFRQWHPQAVSFSHLLLLVVSDHSSQSNPWKDDVVHYLRHWAEENPRDGDDTISIKNLINGLRTLAYKLE